MVGPKVLTRLKRIYDGHRFNRMVEREKSLGYRLAYRSSIRNRINRRDVGLVESTKERALIFLMLCEELDDLIWKHSRHKGHYDAIRKEIEVLVKKAAGTEISILDEDLAAVRYMIDALEEAAQEIKTKARSFLQRKDLRYSTLKIFLDRVKQETEPLAVVLADLITLMADMDRNVDRVIYAQDEAIVTGEYNDETKARQQAFGFQINQQIRETRERLDVTVAAIRSVFIESA